MILIFLFADFIKKSAVKFKLVFKHNVGQFYVKTKLWECAVIAGTTIGAVAFMPLTSAGMGFGCPVIARWLVGLVGLHGCCL